MYVRSDNQSVEVYVFKKLLSLTLKATVFIAVHGLLVCIILAGHGGSGFIIVFFLWEVIALVAWILQWCDKAVEDVMCDESMCDEVKIGLRCPKWDSGWCYAGREESTNAWNGACQGCANCPLYKKLTT